MHRLCCFLTGSILLSAGFGCGGGPKPPEVGTVTGTILLDQQPLADATVMFQPESGRPSFGKTDSAGRYELEYMAGTPGAVLGKHKIIIRTRIDGEDGEPPIAPETLPRKYHDETELGAEVKPGQNTLDFPLTSS